MDLAPQNSFVRRYQHEMAEKASLTSRSHGKEPYRSVRVYRDSQMTKGLFITLEGPDGSGKTTQARLLAEWLTAQGYPLLTTREPGGTRIGEAIRAVVHDCAHVEMSPQAEILLYSASRAQLVAEVIRPALAAGKIVLCDRYFDSTFAYQGYGRSLPLDALRAITDFAVQDLIPDLTLYLDVSPEVGLQRRERSGEAN